MSKPTATSGDVTDPRDISFSKDPRLGSPPGSSGTPAERAAREIDADPRLTEFWLSFYAVTAEEVAAARAEAKLGTGRR